MFHVFYCTKAEHDRCWSWWSFLASAFETHFRVFSTEYNDTLRNALVEKGLKEIDFTAAFQKLNCLRLLRMKPTTDSTVLVRTPQTQAENSNDLVFKDNSYSSVFFSVGRKFWWLVRNSASAAASCASLDTFHCSLPKINQYIACLAAVNISVVMERQLSVFRTTFRQLFCKFQWLQDALTPMLSCCTSWFLTMLVFEHFSDKFEELSSWKLITLYGTIL